MEATGDCVALATELSTGVQNREHDLDSWLSLGLDHVDRNASTVVDDADTAVFEDRDLDMTAVAR